MKLNTAKTYPKEVITPSKITSIKTAPMSQNMNITVIICRIVKIMTPLDISDIFLPPFYQ